MSLLLLLLLLMWHLYRRRVVLQALFNPLSLIYTRIQHHSTCNSLLQPPPTLMRPCYCWHDRSREVMRCLEFHCVYILGIMITLKVLDGFSGNLGTARYSFTWLKHY